jgi:DNA-directed RNA polymerase specialized sigma54-like protein
MLKEIPRAQRRPPAKPLMDYQTEFVDAPGTGMALAYLSGDYSMKAVAEAFGVHYSTVSRAIKVYEVPNDG